ncbi:MAG: rpmG [Oscillospiraceae bacterium]|nr:rpmG [Oscillospiraceae bacterium]
MTKQQKLCYDVNTSKRVYFFVHFLDGVPFTREAKKSDYAGGAAMRVKVTLACTECKQRNYNTMKNKKNDPDRLEMNKYCRFCKKHTAHKETK